MAKNLTDKYNRLEEVTPSVDLTYKHNRPEEITPLVTGVKSCI